MFDPNVFHTIQICLGAAMIGSVLGGGWRSRKIGGRSFPYPSMILTFVLGAINSIFALANYAGKPLDDSTAWWAAVISLLAAVFILFMLVKLYWNLWQIACTPTVESK